MVHEKYIKRGGKTYGPYYYESYRENGKVKKRYVLHNEVKNESGYSRVIPILFVVLILSGLFLIFVGVVGNITGRVTTEIQTDYVFGENVSGTLAFNLQAGELIPTNSIVRVSLGDFSQDFVLEDLVSADLKNGSFYADGVGLSGEGSGFGVLGRKTIYPDIEFEALLTRVVEDDSSENETEEESNETVVDANVTTSGNETEINVTVNDSSSEENNVTISVNGTETDDQNTTEGNSSVSEVQVEEEVEVSQENETEEETNSSLITGLVISENVRTVSEKISVTINGEKSYSVGVGDGGNAGVVSGTVELTTGIELDRDVIDVSVENGIATFSTDYSDTEEGYGAEYDEGSSLSLGIDLNEFGIEAAGGILSIELLSEGVEVTNAKVALTVSGPLEESLTESNQTAVVSNVTSTNVTVGSNLSLIKEFGLTRISKNGSIEINLSEYFANADEYSFNVSNVSAEFSGSSVVLSPDEGFSGARKGKFNASRLENGIIVESLESNEFSILVSSGAVNVQTSRSKIRVGEKVKWTKNLTVEAVENLSIELPLGSDNITIKKVEEEEVVQENVTARGSITGNVITGEVISGRVTAEIEIGNLGFFGFLRNLFGGITGRAITEEEVEETIEVVVEVDAEDLEDEADGVEEVVIEYETEAPTSTEVATGTGKQVTISGPDHVPYEDVIAFTDIGNAVPIVDADRIKLYWRNTEKEVEELKVVDEVEEVEIIDGNDVEVAESVEEETEVQEIKGSSLLTGNVINEVNVTLNESSNASVVNASKADLDVVVEEEYVWQQVPFDAYDLDGEGNLDYLEWVVPHLSNQTFDLIFTDLNSTNATGLNITFEGHDSEQFIHLELDSTWLFNQTGYGQHGDVVGYWTFDKDNSTTAFDFANDHDGNYTGSITPSTSGCLSGFDECVDFDASDDYISITDDVALDLISNFTVAYWCYVEQASVVNCAITKHSVSGISGYASFLSSDNKFYFQGGNGGSWPTHSVASSSTYGVGWHHVVASVNPYSIDLYVNGASAGTGSGGEVAVNSKNLYFGLNANDLSTHYRGRLDEVMVINASLNASSASLLFQNQSSRFKNPGIVETNQFSVDKGGDTVDLELQDYARNFGSNISARIGTWEVGWDYNVSDFDNDRDLVGYWNFDNRSSLGENQTYVVDRAYYLSANNGSANGNAQPNVTDGVYDGSYGFDGNGDHVEIGDVIVDSVDALSFALWAKFNDLGKDNTLLSKGEFNVNVPILVWRDEGTSSPCSTDYDTISFLVSTGSTDARICADSGASNDTGWHFIAGTYNGGASDGLKLYIDGNPVATPVSTTSVGSLENSADNLRFGAPDPTNSDKDLNGNLDEVMIFNRTLTDSEVRDLYVKGRANWNYTTYQNLTKLDGNDNLSRNQFTIADNTTNILPGFMLIAGNGTGPVRPFYSPILKATASVPASLNHSGECGYVGGGDWIVEAHNNCTITEDVDLEGNNFVVRGKGLFTLDGVNISNFAKGTIIGNSPGDVKVVLKNGGRIVTLFLGLLKSLSTVITISGAVVFLNLISFNRGRKKEVNA